MLCRPLRRLKEDTVPTIFVDDAEKQSSKRRANVLREEAGTKNKLCDDSFMHREIVQIFEFEINAKATQTFQSNKQMTIASVTHRLIEQGLCKLSGDGRCDSPVYNAKYLTYSLINQKTNEIIVFSITQVTEAEKVEIGQREEHSCKAIEN